MSWRRGKRERERNAGLEAQYTPIKDGEDDVTNIAYSERETVGVGNGENNNTVLTVEKYTEPVSANIYAAGNPSPRKQSKKSPQINDGPQQDFPTSSFSTPERMMPRGCAQQVTRDLSVHDRHPEGEIAGMQISRLFGEAHEKVNILPQSVRNDLDAFLNAYKSFICHGQDSVEGWGVSAKLTNVLDRISLTEGDKYAPLRIQRNSEGYREIEKHIKSVLTTANGMKIKVNKWLEEDQSGDIETSEMIRALEVQVWMRMKVWEDEKDLGWRYLECVMCMKAPEGVIEQQKFGNDLKSLLRLGFHLMPEPRFCNWLMETLTVGFKISLHDDYGPNLVHELLEELKRLPQEPYSIHRFLIPAYDVLGVHIQLQKKTNTCLISTVLPGSVAYYHGVEEGDEILSPVGDEIGKNTYDLFHKAAKSGSIAFVVKRHVKTVETTTTNHWGKMWRPHRFVITEPGSLGLTLSAGNEQDRDAEKPMVSSDTRNFGFLCPIMVSSVASNSLSDIYGLQKGDIFRVTGIGGAQHVAIRPFFKLINSAERPLTLEVLRCIVPKSVESSIAEEAYMKAMQEKQGMGENPFNFNRMSSCETEAKVAEGVHEEDASHKVAEGVHEEDASRMNGYDADGKSTCESKTEVVEDVESQRGASHSLSHPPIDLSSTKTKGKCPHPCDGGGDVSGSETKFSDDDGMSSCESETEVVEGVENQRGALHSLSDPPANLSSKKSNGKCRRPPKKKNGNSKNRGKSRSDHVLVNDKKANKKEHGSRVIINHSLPVLHGVPNDRTCILDSLCAHIGDPSVKQALVSSFYQMMPKHGDTSIQLANKILDEHGMILKRATPEYQGDQDGCMDFKLLMQRKCRLIVSVSLYDLKEPDRYAPHCVAWDGELIHDRPNSVRVNNTSDRTPAKSRAVFNRLFHKKIYSRWEFGDIYELVDSPN
jgi:hypothetical protein